MRKVLIFLTTLLSLATTADAGTSITFNGSSYTVPAVADASWGTNVSNYLIAIAAGTLQKSGGTFTLTAEVDFGATYGLRSAYFRSKATNTATAGAVRLGNAEQIEWRNAGNSANLGVYLSTSDWLQFNAVDLVDKSTAQTLTNKSMSGSANTFTNLPLTSAVTGILPPANGGTGIANNASSTLTISGNYATTLTVTNTTGVTLPTTGTLMTLAGTESPTNKTFDSTTTLTGAKMASFTPDGSHTLTAPTVTDTLVAKTTTDTLTNKTLTSPTINGGTHTAITSLGIRDTSAAFDVTVAAASSTALTAGHTLTIDMINADKTIKLGGNLTTANTFTTSGNNALTLTTTGSTNVTLPTSGTLFNNGRTISTTAPITGGGDLSTDRTIAIPAGTNSANGYIASGDWTTFNAKVGTARTINTTSPITGGGDLSADRTIAIPAADGTHNGYLASGDWTSFNSLVAGSVPSTRTISTTAPITGGGDLSANRTFAISAASSSAAGSVSFESSGTTSSATFSGARTINSVNVYWARTGNVVTVQWDRHTGSSCSAGTLSSSGVIASGFRPVSGSVINVVFGQDNAADKPIVLSISSAGTMTFQSQSGGNFTNGANCGFYEGSTSFTVN